MMMSNPGMSAQTLLGRDAACSLLEALQIPMTRRHQTLSFPRA